MSNDRERDPIEPDQEPPAIGAARRPRRKPYTRPTVVRYGDVAHLTRNGSIGAKNDKGSGSKTRTN